MEKIVSNRGKSDFESNEFKIQDGGIHNSDFESNEFKIQDGRIQSKNEYGQGMAREISPMEKILYNPGLVHLAEKIFVNLDEENLDVCGQINQSMKQIIANPIFWLRKISALHKDGNVTRIEHNQVWGEHFNGTGHKCSDMCSL